MAKSFWGSWFWRAKHWASGQFAGAGVDVAEPAPTIRSSTNLTAPSSSESFQIVVYHFGSKHFGRYLVLDTFMGGDTFVFRDAPFTTGTSTAFRASSNSSVLSSYDSTLLNASHYHLAGRHFGRYQVIHGLYSYGGRAIRSSSNI